MVDFQLTSSLAVRDLIKEQYDMCVFRFRAEGLVAGSDLNTDLSLLIALAAATSATLDATPS